MATPKSSTAARARELFGPSYRKILEQTVPTSERATLREKAGLPDWILFETYADVIAAKQYVLALEGDQEAIKEIANRTDGKPIQQIDHGWTGGPIPIVGMTLEQLQEREKELEEELKALAETTVEVVEPVSGE